MSVNGRQLRAMHINMNSINFEPLHRYVLSELNIHLNMVIMPSQNRLSAVQLQHFTDRDH